MKKIWVFALAGLLPSIAQADWGLGVSVNSDDGTIYVPIDVSEGFRLEPYFGYIKDESDFGGGFSGEFKAMRLGLGLFGRSTLTERTHAYYGARVAYVDSETTGGFGGEEDGFQIEPTLGGEYFLSDQFAVGVEAYFFYSKLDGTSSSGFDTESKTTGTDARLIARFFFP